MTFHGEMVDPLNHFEHTIIYRQERHRRTCITERERNVRVIIKRTLLKNKSSVLIEKGSTSNL